MFFLCVCCNVLTGASHCLSCKSTSQKLCACTCTTCDYLGPCQGDRVLCHGTWWCRPPSPSQPQWPTANWKFTQHNKVYLTSIKIHMLNKPDLTNLWFMTHLWAELCAFIHLYIYIYIYIYLWCLSLFDIYATCAITTINMWRTTAIGKDIFGCSVISSHYVGTIFTEFLSCCRCGHCTMSTRDPIGMHSSWEEVATGFRGLGVLTRKIPYALKCMCCHLIHCSKVLISK
jgi:hypothetical protein